jgi:hypothetical protein
MHLRRTITYLTVFAALALLAGCSGQGMATPSGQPDRATVDKAASLAFATGATCGRPDRYQEYVCAEHPSVCGVANDGTVDSTVKHAGCWQIVCDAELGVTTKHPAAGAEDFYYCQRLVAGCDSMDGGCPEQDICVTGHRRSLAIDVARSEALPGNGAGVEFSCPYHDEG